MYVNVVYECVLCKMLGMSVPLKLGQQRQVFIAGSKSLSTQNLDPFTEIGYKKKDKDLEKIIMHSTC